MPATVTIQRAVKGAPSPAQLRKWVAAALGRQRGEVTVRIVGPAESRRLNRRYRKKDQPTNVLSFPYDDPAPGRQRVLGDVVICAAVVNREAREQGKRPAAHWAHMVVHGALHLLGFDHIEPADARVMEGRERAILARLSFPDPYQPPS
ncbi:MAG: rRNA maturation RNase YbeY [Gammaproteobacteria bacterium]